MLVYMQPVIPVVCASVTKGLDSVTVFFSVVEMSHFNKTLCS